jgi:hypothetical protein
MPEGPRELVHDVVEEVRSLEHEAEEGASARTPAIVLSGIMLVVGAIVLTLLVVASLAYVLSQ